MICSALLPVVHVWLEHNRVGGSSMTATGALRRGAVFHEASLVRENSADALSAEENFYRHLGKDAAIENFLGGGAGYSCNPFEVSIAATCFDLGSSTERRDMRSLLAWQRSLNNCKLDYQRGRTDG